MILDDIKTMRKCALSDGIFKARLAEIIANLGIMTVVETGIDYGGSTYQFSQMVPTVFGIDNDKAKVDIVAKSLDAECVSNVSLMCVNSPDGLRMLIDSGLDASTTLFLLDAHWQAYWPLKDEIRQLPRGQGVIVTHDTVVPNSPELKFDVYNGQALSYEYLQDVLTEWSPEHAIEYNQAAEWPSRGVMFVYATEAVKAQSGAVR